MSTRSARAASQGCSPASQAAMSAFQQRLTPLALRAPSACSAASSAETTPMAAGLQGPGSSPGSPLLAATPASLGRMLRQAASGPGGGVLAGEQLSRSLASYQEQQQLLASAGKAAAAALSAERPLPRNDSSMQQAAGQQQPTPAAAAERPPSAGAVQHKLRAKRPPTPTSMSGDFKIAAYRVGGGTSHSRGPSPSGEAGTLCMLRLAAARPAPVRCVSPACGPRCILAAQRCRVSFWCGAGSSRIPRAQGSKAAASVAGTPRHGSAA